MRNLKNKILKPLLLAFLISMNQTPALAVEDSILAVVNDQIITLRDLREFLRSTYVNMVASGMDENTVREQIVKLQEKGLVKLIEERLLLSRANAVGLEIKEKLIEDKIEALIAKYDNEQAFLAAISDNGLTLSDVRRKFEDQLKIQYIIDFEVRSKVFVNPKDVTNYYNDNKELFRQNEQLELDSIFISFEEGKKDAAREKANEAYSKVKDGSDFLTIAEEYSETPSIGKIEKGQLLPIIEDEIFNLEIGDISQIIEVDNGLYIFRIIDRLPPDLLPLEEVREKIRDTLEKIKYKERFSEWMDELKEDAYIEIKD